MKPTGKMPLFIVTGASCVGKSAMCEVLFRNEKDYLVMESDILWHDVYNTPDDEYRAFREVWMRVCKNISQIGMPVVLCGCAVPKQFEPLDDRKSFTDIHYLAVVCDNDVLEKRLAERGVTDADWTRSSIEFNAWLKEHARKTDPQMCLLDSSKLSPEEAAEVAGRWIRERMEGNGRRSPK
jgi:broad-specificity NMP kinase